MIKANKVCWKYIFLRAWVDFLESTFGAPLHLSSPPDLFLWIIVSTLFLMGSIKLLLSFFNESLFKIFCHAMFLPCTFHRTMVSVFSADVCAVFMCWSFVWYTYFKGLWAVCVRTLSSIFLKVHGEEQIETLCAGYHYILALCSFSSKPRWDKAELTA